MQAMPPLQSVSQMLMVARVLSDCTSKAVELADQSTLAHSFLLTYDQTVNVKVFIGYQLLERVELVGLRWRSLGTAIVSLPSSEGSGMALTMVLRVLERLGRDARPCERNPVGFRAKIYKKTLALAPSKACFIVSLPGLECFLPVSRQFPRKAARL